MLNQLIERAKRENIKKIKGEFIPTAKNKPAENFYKEFSKFFQEFLSKIFANFAKKI